MKPTDRIFMPEIYLWRKKFTVKFWKSCGSALMEVCALCSFFFKNDLTNATHEQSIIKLKSYEPIAVLVQGSGAEK